MQKPAFAVSTAADSVVLVCLSVSVVSCIFRMQTIKIPNENVTSRPKLLVAEITLFLCKKDQQLIVCVLLCVFHFFEFKFSAACRCLDESFTEAVEKSLYSWLFLRNRALMAPLQICLPRIFKHI